MHACIEVLCGHNKHNPICCMAAETCVVHMDSAKVVALDHSIGGEQSDSMKPAWMPCLNSLQLKHNVYETMLIAFPMNCIALNKFIAIVY